MKEDDVLKLLEIDIKGLKKILAENLNMKSKDIKIEYDKGVFNINGGKPLISVKEHECFDGTNDLSKSIFFGLPVINPLSSYDRPIGGEVCLATDLFVKCVEQKYPTKRSNRYRKFEPVGYQKAPKGNEILRKGHILFAWLVDRFSHETEFLPVEKKMMYFTQLRDSNEPVKSIVELNNHFRYEEKLQKLLEKKEIEFNKFRYSVRLIYRNEEEGVPMATLLQLVTDSDNPEHRFNILTPNIIYNNN